MSPLYFSPTLFLEPTFILKLNSPLTIITPKSNAWSPRTFRKVNGQGNSENHNTFTVICPKSSQ